MNTVFFRLILAIALLVDIGNSIIIGRLTVNAIGHVRLQIENSNINMLVIYNSYVEVIDLRYCNIGAISFKELTIERFLTLCNKMDFLEVSNSIFEDVECKGDHLDLKEIIKGRNNNSFDPIEFQGRTEDEVFETLGDKQMTESLPAPQKKFEIRDQRRTATRNGPFSIFSGLFPTFSESFSIHRHLLHIHVPIRRPRPPAPALRRNMLRRRAGAGGRETIEKPGVVSLTKSEFLSFTVS